MLATGDQQWNGLPPEVVNSLSKELLDGGPFQLENV